MLERRLLSVIHSLGREKRQMPSDGVAKCQPGDIGERIVREIRQPSVVYARDIKG
jgi:hypothetical protein